MYRLLTWPAACLLLAAAPAFARPKAVSFKASDGLTVYAELSLAKRARTAPVLLLFHQAGSNASEYAPIAPRLVAAGYNCLAVNLRGGGTMFGADNPTARQLAAPDYAKAYLDMQASLAFVKSQGFGGPRLAWGSSYTAAAVMRFANDHAEITAVLAYSPGLGAVNAPWTRKVKVPVYITGTAGREETLARQTAAAIPHDNKTVFIQAAGLHGSSTLHERRNPKGASANWTSVMRFLASLHKPRKR